MNKGDFELIHTAFGVVLDEGQRDKMARYIRLLRDWSGRVRLISKGDRNYIWERHIIDSFAFIPSLQACTKMMDFGSGSGLPGIPLSIVCPDLSVHLLEPTRMKALFLQQVVQELSLSNTSILRYRSEDIEANDRYQGKYPLITARAVASLPKLWAMAKPLLSDTGRLVTLKGPHARDEFEGNLPTDLKFEIEQVIIPVSQRERSIVTLSHVSRETQP